MNSADAERITLVSRSILLAHLIVEVSDALSCAGVRAIVLKGPVTARLLYDDPRLRHSGDIDFLVSPQDWPKAAEVLDSLGYRDVWAGTSARERSEHAREFAGPRAEVDLHRHLPGIGLEPQAAWTILEDGAVAFQLESGTVKALAPAAQVLHLMLNAAHGGAAGRPAEELGLALQRVPPSLWRDAAALSHRLDCVGTVLAGFDAVPGGLAFARGLGLDEPVPTGAAVRARTESLAAVRLQDLAETRGLRAKASLIARELVPTSAFLRTASPLAQRGRLGLVAAYLARPFQVAGQLWPAFKEWRTLRRSAGGSDGPSPRSPGPAG